MSDLTALLDDLERLAYEEGKLRERGWSLYAHQVKQQRKELRQRIDKLLMEKDTK